METLVQMNVRIGESRKASGDAVLTKFGVSPSQAVRSLWDFLSESKKLPDFMIAKDPDVEATDRSTGAQLAEEGAGLACRLASEAGLHCASIQDLSYEELREAAFEERLAEAEQRHV